MSRAIYHVLAVNRVYHIAHGEARERRACVRRGRKRLELLPIAPPYILRTSGIVWHRAEEQKCFRLCSRKSSEPLRESSEACGEWGENGILKRNGGENAEKKLPKACYAY